MRFFGEMKQQHQQRQISDLCVRIMQGVFRLVQTEEILNYVIENGRNSDNFDQIHDYLWTEATFNYDVHIVDVVHILQLTVGYSLFSNKSTLTNWTFIGNVPKIQVHNRTKDYVPFYIAAATIIRDNLKDASPKSHAAKLNLLPKAPNSIAANLLKVTTNGGERNTNGTKNTNVLVAIKKEDAHKPSFSTPNSVATLTSITMSPTLEESKPVFSPTSFVPFSQSEEFNNDAEEKFQRVDRIKTPPSNSVTPMLAVDSQIVDSFEEEMAIIKNANICAVSAINDVKVDHFDDAISSLSLLRSALIGLSESRKVAITCKFLKVSKEERLPFELLLWFMTNYQSVVEQNRELEDNKKLFCLCFKQFYNSFKNKVAKSFRFHLYVHVPTKTTDQYYHVVEANGFCGYGAVNFCKKRHLVNKYNGGIFLPLGDDRRLQTYSWDFKNCNADCEEFLENLKTNINYLNHSVTADKYKVSQDMVNRWKRLLEAAKLAIERCIQDETFRSKSMYLRKEDWVNTDMFDWLFREDPALDFPMTLFCKHEKAFVPFVPQLFYGTTVLAQIRNREDFTWLSMQDSFAWSSVDNDTSCVGACGDAIKEALAASKGNNIIIDSGHFYPIDIDTNAMIKEFEEALQSYCMQLFVYLIKIAKVSYTAFLDMTADEYQTKVNQKRKEGNYANVFKTEEIKRAYVMECIKKSNTQAMGITVDVDVNDINNDSNAIKKRLNKLAETVRNGKKLGKEARILELLNEVETLILS